MWKYYEIYCVNITIYIKEKKIQTEDFEKKKPITTVVTVPLGTIAIVQNFKKIKK